MMWVLSFFPDFVWHMLTLCGFLALAVSIFLKNVPFIFQYKLILQYGGAVALLLGVWMEGGIANEQKWQARVKELESKIAIAEARSKDENVKIVTKVVTKREYYKERGNDIIQYVDREITKYDNTCPVPREVVKAHNNAAVPGDSK